MRVESLLPLLVAAGCGTPGIDLFLHSMPAEALAGVVVLPSLAGSAINPDLPGWRKNAGFQVVARSPALPPAMALADRAFRALTVNRRTLLPAIPAQGVPAILLSYIRPLNDPQPYPRLLSKSWEVSTNFFATYAIQQG